MNQNEIAKAMFAVTEAYRTKQLLPSASQYCAFVGSLLDLVEVARKAGAKYALDVHDKTGNIDRQL